jgi:hypothetical protein
LAYGLLSLAVGAFVACSADSGDALKSESSEAYSGASGGTVSDAASGSAGSSGTTGSTGTTGSSGSTGTTGSTGSTGTAGSSGSTGSTGTTGSSATSGSASTDMDGAALDGTGALDSSVADSAVVEDTSIARDTSVEDAFAADASVGEAGHETGPDAAVSDASNGGSDAAAVCETMWPEGGTNLVTNPSFESSASGWSAQFGGGTFGVSSTTAHCGTQSGEISNRSAYYDALSTPISTTAGTYTVALWVLQDGTSSLQMTIQGYGTCGSAQYINLGPATGTGFPTVAPNTWTFVSGTLTVPTGCTAMDLIIEQDGAQSALPDLFVDDVYVGE